jgi:REP element-mobilizing transposase RayT
MRKTINIQNGNYYHIYNRGVDKRNVFIDKYDYLRFLVSLKEFNQDAPAHSLYHQQKIQNTTPRGSTPLRGVEPLNKPRVSIICYVLLPNHLHLLLRKISDYGISEYMKRIGAGYTGYFNAKYKRSGALFQGKYKIKPVKTEGYLIKLSAYIHGNPEIHGITKAEGWIWSSYQDFLGKRPGRLPAKNDVLINFKSVKEYGEYANIIIKEASQIKDEMKELIIE